MHWSNLKNNKCPQCNKGFMTGLKVKNSTTDFAYNQESKQTELVKLMIHSCGFKISERIYKKIVAGMMDEKLSRGVELDYVVEDETI